MTRLMKIALGAVVVIIVGAAIASRITLDYYVLSPGEAQSVGPLIKVPASHAHRVHGSVLLTDVFLGPVTALSYLPDRFWGNNQLVPTDALVPTGIPVSELNNQGYLEMVQAKAAAKAAALRRLGYSVPEHNAGVVIAAVESGVPAFGVLKVGQVITAVNGVPVETVCDLSQELASLQPNQTVQLSIQQNRFSASGSLVPGRTASERVRVVRRPSDEPPTCPGTAAPTVMLGIAPQTQLDFTFPFPITINTADIGGPSAGLAMTLGLINTLSGGHLTGGRTVAATGTIDASGEVGDVGGVAQKTIAVERAGATVFFVPGPELGAARSEANSTLHVYAVNSLAQTLSILKRLGGAVPDSPSAH